MILGTEGINTFLILTATKKFFVRITIACHFLFHVRTTLRLWFASVRDNCLVGVVIRQLPGAGDAEIKPYFPSIESYQVFKFGSLEVILPVTWLCRVSVRIG